MCLHHSFAHSMQTCCLSMCAALVTQTHVADLTITPIKPTMLTLSPGLLRLIRCLLLEQLVSGGTQ